MNSSVTLPMCIASRRLRRPAMLVAAVSFTACLLPGEPSDAERVGFLLEFEQPYRVPMGAAVTPPIKIVVKDKVLENPSYRLETAGIVRVDSTGRGLLGLARGTTSVRLVYATATGSPDTVFDVRVVVSGVALDTFVRPLTRIRDSTTLTARALDATGAVVPVPAFRWRSSNPEVATVDSSRGVVTAIDEGTASITAEVDQVSGSVSVTVIQVAAAVLVSPKLDTLRSLRGTLRYAALVFDSTGAQLRTARPRWSTTDAAVATVDPAGVVTATGGGTTRIIARVGQAADTATLVVAQVAWYIFVTPSLHTLTAIDDTTRLVAQVWDSSNSAIPNPKVTWTINDATIATVEQTGVVRAKKNGAVLVTASSGRQSAFATVVVRQAVAQVNITEDSVTLAGEGATVRLEAVGFDRNGYAVLGATRFAWSSRLAFVATVDSTGLVAARGDGTTRITASPLDVSIADTAGASSDTATVTVIGAPQELIAFESQRGIEVVRPDGSQRSVLIYNVEDLGEPFGLTYTDPSWSPDGTRLALTAIRWDWGDCSTDNGPGCWDVYTVSTVGSDSVNASRHPAVDDEATWSPDGTKIAFTSTRGAPPRWCCEPAVYLMNADGSNVKRLTDVPGANPAWSPDGSRVAFELRHYFWEEYESEIYIVNADGTGAVNLTNHEAHDYQPAWSPDGSQLAFVSNRDSYGRDDIWLMNADGTGARNLTSSLSVYLRGETNPAWSPDGTRIAFVGAEALCCPGPTDIYVMRVDGTDVRRLTSTNEWEWRPTWRSAAPLNAPPVGPRRQPASAR